MKNSLYITFTILLAAAIQGNADVLQLQDGDSLSGKVIRVAENTLVFRCTLSGQLMVPMDTVRRLDTDHDLVVTLADNKVLYGRLAGKEGRNYLFPIDGAAPRVIALAEIQEAVVIPAPPENASGGEDAGAAWRGAIQVGGQYRGGNRDGGDAAARLEVAREGRKTDFQTEVLVELDANDTFPEFLRGSARLARDAEGAANPYAELRALRDTSRSLDLRAEMSLGLQWPIGGKSTRGLSGLTGVNLAYEDWEHRRTRQQENRKDVNLHLGLRYARDVFGKGRLREDLYFYPSITDLGDLRVESNTALLFPVTTKLHLRLDLLVEYDNTLPFSRIDHWQTAVGAGIQVNF